MNLSFFEKFVNETNLFDVFFFLILTFFVIRCFLKGFSLSLISFMKWVISLIVTIILVPKFQPIVSDYIKSDFVNNVGLGVVIFIITLFITILIGKTLSRAITWTGVGSIDKGFGFIFGFFALQVVLIFFHNLFLYYLEYFQDKY